MAENQQSSAEQVTVEIGTESFPARATIVEGAERQRVYDRMVAQLPAFGEYQTMTARQLPKMVVERAR